MTKEYMVSKEVDKEYESKGVDVDALKMELEGIANRRKEARRILKKKYGLLRYYWRIINRSHMNENPLSSGSEVADMAAELYFESTEFKNLRKYGSKGIKLTSGDY